MAVIGCEEIKNRSGSVDTKFTVSLSRSYLVKCDNPDTSEVAITNAPGWAIGMYHPFQTNAAVTNISYSQGGEDHRWFVVDVQFGSRPSDEDDPEDPLDAPAKITGGSSQEQQTYEKDATGTPILNTAKQPFLDLPVRDKSNSILTIQKNFPWDEVSLSELHNDYINTTNNSTWRGNPKDTVRLVGMDWTREFAQTIGAFYASVTFNFSIDPNKHTQEIQSKGMKYLDQNNKLQKFNSNGEPGLLDQNGNKLAQGAKPHYITFYPYFANDFSALGLDDA